MTLMTQQSTLELHRNIDHHVPATGLGLLLPSYMVSQGNYRLLDVRIVGEARIAKAPNPRAMASFDTKVKKFLAFARRWRSS